MLFISKPVHPPPLHLSLSLCDPNTGHKSKEAENTSWTYPNINMLLYLIPVKANKPFIFFFIRPAKENNNFEINLPKKSGEIK